MQFAHIPTEHCLNRVIYQEHESCQKSPNFRANSCLMVGLRIRGFALEKNLNSQFKKKLKIIVLARHRSQVDKFSGTSVYRS